jgi:hypothetical protein
MKREWAEALSAFDHIDPSDAAAALNLGVVGALGRVGGSADRLIAWTPAT